MLRSCSVLSLLIISVAIAFGQPLPRGRVVNLRPPNPRLRYIAPLTPPRIPQRPPLVDTISPARGAERQQTAGAASAADVAKICARLDCSGGPVLTGMVTRSGNGSGPGVIVAEHAESECLGCGAQAGAARHLVNPPKVTNRLYPGDTPRPADGVAGMAARDARQALDRTVSPFVERAKKGEPQHRLGQRTARFGLKTVCPFGGKCSQFETFTRGASLTSGDTTYEGTSIRCRAPGCKAEADTVVGTDGSQRIEARRGDKFWKGSNGIQQRDPATAKAAQQGARQLRLKGLSRTDAIKGEK